jgi:hypothetical protein
VNFLAAVVPVVQSALSAKTQLYPQVCQQSSKFLLHQWAVGKNSGCTFVQLHAMQHRSSNQANRTRPQPGAVGFVGKKCLHACQTTPYLPTRAAAKGDPPLLLCDMDCGPWFLQITVEGENIFWQGVVDYLDPVFDNQGASEGILHQVC